VFIPDHRRMRRAADIAVWILSEARLYGHGHGCSRRRPAVCSRSHRRRSSVGRDATAVAASVRPSWRRFPLQDEWNEWKRDHVRPLRAGTANIRPSLLLLSAAEAIRPQRPTIPFYTHHSIPP